MYIVYVAKNCANESTLFFKHKADFLPWWFAELRPPKMEWESYKYDKFVSFVYRIIDSRIVSSFIRYQKGFQLTKYEPKPIKVLGQH